MTNIGNNVFEYCFNLSSITILRDYPPTIGEGSGSYLFKPWDWEERKDYYIYVPAGAVDRYKSHNLWRIYEKRIKAIP